MLSNTRVDGRLYEVIGFKSFEDLYLKHLAEGTENNRWLERVIRLFNDLNVKRNDAFDARAQQLRDVCSSAIELVNVLESIDFGVKKTDPQKWPEVQRFDKEVNPHFYETPA